MCDFGSFVNDFCLSRIDKYIEPSGVVSYSIAGVLLEVFIFLLAFHFITTLGFSFMNPAFESLSLRKGGFGEVIASIFISVTLAIPEVTLSFISAIKGQYSSNHSLAISTILGSGWISMLLIPGLIGVRAPVSVSREMFLRDFGFYSILCVILGFILHDNSVSILESLLLLLMYGPYFGLVSYIQRKEQDMRQKRREERLLVQLTPLRLAIEEYETLERLPYDMIELVENDPGHPSGSLIGNYAPVSTKDSSSGDSDPLFHSTEPLEDTWATKLLNLICVRAIPGTASEQYYAIALLNTFILQLLFSSLVSAVSNRWIEMASRDIQSQPNIVGSLVVAMFSQLTEILKAITAKDNQNRAHVIMSSMSSQIFAISIGLGLPWLITSLINGSTPVDSGAVSQSLRTTFGSIILFAIFIVLNYRNGQLLNMKYLIPVYIVAIVGFILASL
jgi:Ca2+/Na+ antiporter